MGFGAPVWRPSPTVLGTGTTIPLVSRCLARVVHAGSSSPGRRGCRRNSISTACSPIYIEYERTTVLLRADAVFFSSGQGTGRLATNGGSTVPDRGGGTEVVVERGLRTVSFTKLNSIRIPRLTDDSPHPVGT